MNKNSITESDWNKEGFSQRFSQVADIQIPMRARMFKTLLFFYKYHFKEEKRVNLLDLGCGDGVLAYELIKANPCITATLVDGSDEMVELARKRFSGNKEIEIIPARFEDLVLFENFLSDYDLVISSLAIHHLTSEDRKRLFTFIYSHLKKGGYFINIDAVLPPEGPIEDFYLELWKDWIDEMSGVADESRKYFDLIYEHHQNPLHRSKISSLNEQLQLMNETGFLDIDCLMKYGIFAMYIGKKP